MATFDLGPAGTNVATGHTGVGLDGRSGTGTGVYDLGSLDSFWGGGFNLKITGQQTWTKNLTGTTFAVSGVLKKPALVGGSFSALQVRTAAATLLEVVWGSAGSLRLLNGAGTLLEASTEEYDTGQILGFELVGTVGGATSFKIFLQGATAAVEELNGTCTAGTMASVRFGQIGAPNAAEVSHYDQVIIGNTLTALVWGPSVRYVTLGLPSPSGFDVYVQTRGATSVQLTVRDNADAVIGTLTPQTPNVNQTTEWSVRSGGFLSLAPGTTYKFDVEALDPATATYRKLGEGRGHTAPGPTGPSVWRELNGTCFKHGSKSNQNEVWDWFGTRDAHFIWIGGDQQYRESTSPDSPDQRSNIERQFDDITGYRQQTAKHCGWTCDSDHDHGDNNMQPGGEAHTLAWKIAANRVWPSEPADVSRPGHIDDDERYTAFTTGRTRIILLDTRSYYQVGAWALPGGAENPAFDRDDPANRVIGPDQEAWLADELAYCAENRLLPVIHSDMVLKDRTVAGDYVMLENKRDYWGAAPAQRARVAAMMAGFTATTGYLGVFHQGDQHQGAYCPPGMNQHGGWHIISFSGVNVSDAWKGSAAGLDYEVVYPGEGVTMDPMRMGLELEYDYDGVDTITLNAYGWDTLNSVAWLDRAFTFVIGEPPETPGGPILDLPGRACIRKGWMTKLEGADVSDNLRRRADSRELIYATVWLPPGLSWAGTTATIELIPTDGGDEIRLPAAPVNGTTGSVIILGTADTVDLEPGTYDVVVEMNRSASKPRVDAGQLITY